MSQFKKTDNGLKIWENEVVCLCSDEKFASIGITTPKVKDFAITINFTPSGVIEVWNKNNRILRISKKGK
jgi:hypothetical protein